MKLLLHLIFIFIACTGSTRSNELPYDQDIFGDYFFNPNTPATPMITNTPYTPITPYEFTPRSPNSYSTDEEEIDEWLQPMVLDCNDIINSDYESVHDSEVGELNIFTQSLEENQKKFEAILAFRKKHMDLTCCGKPYSDLSSLAKHYDITHAKDGKHICAVASCNYEPKLSFSYAFNHYIKHNNPSFLSCPVPTCAKDFSRLYKLKSHFNKCSLGILYQQKKNQLPPISQPTSEFQQLPRKLQTAINNINYSRVANEHKKRMQNIKQNSINQPVSTETVNPQTAPIAHAKMNPPQSKLTRKLRTIIRSIHTSHGIDYQQPLTESYNDTLVNFPQNQIVVSQDNQSTITDPHIEVASNYEQNHVAQALNATQNNNYQVAAPVSPKANGQGKKPAKKKVIPSKKIDSLPMITKQPNEELRAAILARISKK